MKIYR